jgi:hypothetical protein
MERHILPENGRFGLPTRTRCPTSMVARGVPMSNVDRLVQAGVLNPDVLSSEQKEFINNELTDDEMKELIKVGQKYTKFCRDQPHYNSTATIWV